MQGERLGHVWNEQKNRRLRYPLINITCDGDRFDIYSFDIYLLYKFTRKKFQCSLNCSLNINLIENCIFSCVFHTLHQYYAYIRRALYGVVKDSKIFFLLQLLRIAIV